MTRSRQGPSPELHGVQAPSVRTWTLPERRLEFPRTTLIMGILNVTPDSFSDGGRHLDPGVAVAAGERMMASGAHLLDIGGESTRPGADPVPAEVELQRVLPVIRGLRQRLPGVVLSIDTRKAAVAQAALDAGAQIVNDISALRDDPALPALCARTGAGVILMHMRGEPKTMQVEPCYADVVEEVAAFLAQRIGAAEAAGIARTAMAVDPGICFGKTVAHNLALLRRLDRFAELGCPVVVGTSRKSFLGRLAGGGPEDRRDGTAATVALAAFLGAAVVRVHDVAEMARVAAVADAVTYGAGAAG